MAYKQFVLEGIGTLTIYKRRGTRTMRLSVTPDGVIRMTMPTYVPYQTGIEFARTRRDWLLSQTSKHAASLENAQPIGKQHRLRFTASFTATAPSVRLRGDEIVVTHPAMLSADDSEVQLVAQRGCIRALRQEAEALLPERLSILSAAEDFTYKSVVVKRLRGRWGSCDQHGNIVLNLFLMQLPWELVDYVLIHELTHTKFLHHGADFWEEFLRHRPDAKQLRKRIRQYQPNFVLPQA